MVSVVYFVILHFCIFKFVHLCSTARMSFAPILQLASLRTDPSQTKPEEPKSKLRWLVPSPPLIRIVLVFVIPALLSTLAIQVYLESDTKSHPYFFRLGILLQVLPGSSRLMRRGCNANYFWKQYFWNPVFSGTGLSCPLPSWSSFSLSSCCKTRRSAPYPSPLLRFILMNVMCKESLIRISKDFNVL